MAVLGVSTAEPSERDRANGLLLRVATGDRESFSVLFDQLHEVVRKTVHRVVRDPTLAQDVVQDVFLEVWQTAPRFDAQRGSAFAWVCTIARRRAIDRVRSVQASRDRDRRIGVRDRQDGYDSVWEHVEVASEHERAVKALAKVTALQRECITLAYAEGFSYAEIADRLSVPVGTVKTRMRNGLRALRATMAVD